MLDTNICIYIIKKRTESVLRQLREKMESGLFISTITLSELEFGVANSEHREKNSVALLGFLTIVGIKHFDENAAMEYGAVKKSLRDRGCPIGPMDMLIGAHARSQRMTLVTNNAREFSRIEGLVVENWV